MWLYQARRKLTKVIRFLTLPVKNKWDERAWQFTVTCMPAGRADKWEVYRKDLACVDE